MAAVPVASEPLKMQCTIVRNRLDAVHLRSPASKDINPGLEVLVGKKIGISWRLETGCYAGVTYRSLFPFRFNHTILEVAYRDMPATVKLDVNGHVLYEHRLIAMSPDLKVNCTVDRSRHDDHVFVRTPTSKDAFPGTNVLVGETLDASVGTLHFPFVFQYNQDVIGVTRHGSPITLKLELNGHVLYEQALRTR